jgi:membrane protease YdiL (CAAX protease family)
MTVSEGQAPLPAPGGFWPRGSDDDPRWPASAGLLGLLVALVATFVLSAIVAVAYFAAGVDSPDKSDSFDFAALAAQNLAFVAAALLMAERMGRPSARQFGFRPFKPSALGWAVAGIAVYFVISAIYVAIFQPPDDDLPQQLGADKSTLLAVITGIFVVAVAPVVEEFFFRGFLYQALRTRLGVWGGAVTSGLIFGAIHFKPEFLVPLAVLGTVLALVFQKTGSLWPCILIHAANNALAFAVTV